MSSSDYPSRAQHLRNAYRQLESARVTGHKIDATKTSTGFGTLDALDHRVDELIRSQLLCYAEATAHFAAAAIPDLQSLQMQIVVP